MESRMRTHTCQSSRGVCSGRAWRDKHRNRAARGQRGRESGRKIRGKRTLAAREVLDRVRLAHFFCIVLLRTPHAHPSPSSKYTYTQVLTLVTRRLSERERERGTGRGREREREREITSSTFCVCTIGSIVFFCSSNVIIPGDVEVLRYISMRASSDK
jgi:hypothetical protein